MKLLSAKQVSSLALFFWLIAVGNSCAQSSLGNGAAATYPTNSPSGQSSQVRVYPQLRLQGGLELTYVGMFAPDAVYRASSKASGPNSIAPGEDIAPANSARSGARSSIAPDWMLLSSERVVENFEPPGHAQEAPRSISRPADIRNHVLTYAYGRLSVINRPRELVSDSQGRVVLSDPGANAVHVLDPLGKTSFRMVCGKGYRIHKPAGVAVDAEDNIYVADPEHGMIVVVDRYGNFQRYIGNYRGEPEYARPQGIAIDRARRHLFVVDTPRNLVFELDLDGKELKRLGKNHRGDGIGEFDNPTDIALNHKHIYVLDRSGTRVQVLDLNFMPVGSFDLPRQHDPRRYGENSLATDEEGRVYISYFRDSNVRVYSADGKFLSFFGQNGTKAGQFAEPSGLWVDGRNRLYIADSGNGRVQLFQMKSGTPESGSGASSAGGSAK